MLEVKNLTKNYGPKKAVNDLSFTIEKGRIYGFLGPNGAGKSTTMNIITGCLAATSGEVKIDGYDIVDDAKKARALIGYLPEVPPLYIDMTPFEYLMFVASAKGLNKEEALKSVENALEKTGITSVCDRLIRNLSKGYRQRVGIAEAMLGNPDLIILDEPTVGLDPKQIIDIRELIRKLGEDHTVILSSHILSEIQEICDYIMIISGGKMVASGTLKDIIGETDRETEIRISSRAEKSDFDAVLRGIEGIISYSSSSAEDGSCALIKVSRDDKSAGDRIFSAFAEANIALSELSPITHTLEEVYLELTEKADSIADLSDEAEKSESESYESQFTSNNEDGGADE